MTDNGGKRKSRLLFFVSSQINKLCIISYLLGVVGFLALPYRDISEHHYHSENALLTGLQTPNYGRKEQRTADLINEELVRIQDHSKKNFHGALIDMMKEHGITAYTQSFSFKHPLPTTGKQGYHYQIENGTNVYGFIRAGRAASTESIVLNIPISSENHNYAAGFALSIGRQIRAQYFWAKDIVLLFTEMGYVGSQAWLQSYYGRHSDFIKGDPLQERAGAILAALNLEFPKSPSTLNVEVVGNKGQLPNLDLVNVVSKLCYQNSVRMAVGGFLHRNYRHPQKNYQDSLNMCLKMITKQAKGFTEFNHATFLQHNIQSLTIQGVEFNAMAPIDFVYIGRVVEGTMRSLNNLLEKLHHSYFFYLISAKDRFISIVLYMPPLGLILLAPALKALCLWIVQTNSQGVEDERPLDEDEQYIQRLRADEAHKQQNTSPPWMDVFYRLVAAELLGVILYFSPSFVTSWPTMYGITAEHSLTVIFLSTYLASMMLPFTSFIRFHDDKLFYDLYKLLRVVALLLFSMIVGCTAVLNFSLAMIVAVASVPFITCINTSATRFRRLLYIVMALLASPLIIAIAASLSENFIFGGGYKNLWTIMTTTLTSSYKQSLLENSWNFEFGCLLLYPSWMLFWFIATAKASVEV